jgi:hypothetical protein
MRLYTQDNMQQALSFLVSQTTFLEPAVIRIKYPDLPYASLVPIDGMANEWARSVTFFSLDMTGEAQWFNAQARDVPLADFQREKHEQAIEMAAIGYRYNLEELAVAMMVPNTNLSTERAASCRRAYEEFCHNCVMYGDSRKNWKGLTNHSLPAVLSAPHTWAYQVGLATDAGIAAIVSDVNGLLGGMWQSTLTVEMADTILLPLSAMTLLSGVQLPHTTMNLLEWITANNIYTHETGQRLTIKAIRGLDTAGASGNGRVIAYTNNPEILKLHRPMPHRFLPVWQTGPMVFDVPGVESENEFRQVRLSMIHSYLPRRCKRASVYTFREQHDGPSAPSVGEPVGTDSVRYRRPRLTSIGSAFVLRPRYLAVLSILAWPKSARTVCKSPVPFKMWRAFVRRKDSTL